MQIPPDQNTRAEAMWRIISQRVDFRGKRVIDLGCGTGDFLWRAYVAGASMVDGIDVEKRVVLRPVVGIEDRTIGKNVVYPSIFFHQKSIEDVKEDRNIINGEIALCFSVLPYLDDVPATLKWMSSNFPLCLIECQYAGDGPGLAQIGGDKGMMQLLLSNGFSSAEPIGKTRVEGREYQGSPVYRTIWLCETRKN